MYNEHNYTKKLFFKIQHCHIMCNSLYFQSKTASKLEKVHEQSSHKNGSPRDNAGFIKVAKDTEHGSQCSTPTEVSTQSKQK